jgi:hypothetical protein
MSLRVHLRVQHAHDEDAPFAEHVVDGMSLDVKHAIAFANLVAPQSQFRFRCEPFDSRTDCIDVVVGLPASPLIAAVLPDLDEVVLRARG